MYKVEFTPQAEGSLFRLDRDVAQRIVNKIEWLSQNLDALFPEPLKGRFKGNYKLRVGNWRIIYTFDKSNH